MSARRHILITTQHMVVVGPCPHCTDLVTGLINITGTCRFQTADNDIKRILFAQSNQPMHMVRHQHPRQHLRITQ